VKTGRQKQFIHCRAVTYCNPNEVTSSWSNLLQIDGDGMHTLQRVNPQGLHHNTDSLKEMGFIKVVDTGYPLVDGVTAYYDIRLLVWGAVQAITLYPGRMYPQM
jgi:hypothetical protein